MKIKRGRVPESRHTYKKLEDTFEKPNLFPEPDVPVHWSSDLVTKDSDPPV